MKYFDWFLIFFMKINFYIYFKFSPAVFLNFKREGGYNFKTKFDKDIKFKYKPRIWF